MEAKIKKAQIAGDAAAGELMEKLRQACGGDRDQELVYLASVFSGLLGGSFGVLGQVQGQQLWNYVGSLGPKVAAAMAFPINAETRH